MLNAHIAIREKWPLISANPIPYLNHLRDCAPAPQRDAKIARPPGKFAFGAFVTQNGGRAPESIATIRDGRVIAGASAAGQDIDAFLKSLPPGHYFCKPDSGSNGKGAFRLDISDATALADGAPGSLESISGRLSTAPYIVQASLTPLQHPEIARFNQDAVNTLRLLTYDTQAGPKVVSAAVRTACAPAAVDNWSAGGVLVPADTVTAQLGEFGVIKKGRAIVDAHPQTGQRFGGQAVPYFHEAAQMVCHLHDKLDLASVGWDIALLRDGPCIIEANRYWDIYFSAQLDPGFLRAFLDFHLVPATAAIRLEIAGSFAPSNGLRLWLCEIIGASRASARLIQFSQEKLVLTVGGSPQALEKVMAYVRFSTQRHRFGDIRTIPLQEPVPPGLDIRATFPG